VPLVPGAAAEAVLEAAKETGMDPAIIEAAMGGEVEEKPDFDK